MKQNAIYLEFGRAYLTDEELTEMTRTLATYDIELIAGTQDPRPQMSLYDLVMLISDQLSESIVEQVISSAIYDSIRAAILFAVKAIRDKASIVQSHQVRTPRPCVRLVLEDDEVNILIPTELKDAEFERYFDAAITVIQHEREQPMRGSRRITYLVDIDEETREPHLFTGLEYAKRQARASKSHVSSVPL